MNWLSEYHKIMRAPSPVTELRPWADTLRTRQQRRLCTCGCQG